MHPVLQPNLSTPIAIVSAALWCAAAITAIVVGPGKNNAPLALAAEPDAPFARIIPLTFMKPMKPARTADDTDRRRAGRDRICERGRRYFRDRPGHRSWRCRR
ncbi:hypothetical protein ACVMGC_000964 [Bradyrhizobium barranii subsp. barranii]|uniref:hypothetical protein n=1 Tax=Bradyrhizobium TaxID=374 RepID=UPI001BA53835|nr:MULTISPECIES: hypothetical protein [Bradyrhizobium]MBR0883892.1 hypothetical protein [Bradyrhizobium liaoningense]MCP1778884.1 hypothetical protein [Bradyrhizobium japonicum]MCP1958119.1 hypothetical protein [Bradyrhizobium japonicum]